MSSPALLGIQLLPLGSVIQVIGAHPATPQLCFSHTLQTVFQATTPLIGYQRNYVAEVAAAEAGSGWDIVFYGDSIIERLRGSQG